MHVTRAGEQKMLEGKGGDSEELMGPPRESRFQRGIIRWTLIYWLVVYVFLSLRSVLNPLPYLATQAVLRLGSVAVAVALSFLLLAWFHRLRRLSDSARALSVLAAAVGANVVHALANHIIFYVLPGLWEPKYGPVTAIGSNLLEFFWLFPGWALIYLIVERHHRAIEAEPPLEPVLWASDRGAKTLIPLHLVEWLESEGDYVRLHTAGKSYLIRTTLGSIERMMAGRGFVRVHRRIVVDFNLIDRLKRQADGRLAAVLHGGKELPVGRHYARQVQQFLSISPRKPARSNSEKG